MPLATMLSYVDPTGGLPPPFWGMMLATLIGALAAAAAALKVWGRRVKTSVRTLGRRFVFVAAAIILAGAFMGLLFLRQWGSSSRSDSASPRVLVLAFDGLDPQLLNRYLAEGWLPNFARLAQRGVYHNLTTSDPPQSPVAWSTFITGKSADAHGVFDFIKRDPKTYLPDLSLADRHHLSLSWHGQPLWELPTIAKLGFIAHRLPMIFPAPKIKNGRLLSGMGVWDIRGTEGSYVFLSTAATQPANARGLCGPLTPNGEVLQGELPGPYRAGEPDNLREAIELVVASDRTAARLTVQGTTYRLLPNRWSDWVSVEFRLGGVVMQKVRAVTRVMLDVGNGEVSLYVSPLQFDPRAPVYAISHPRSWSAELADDIGLYSTRGMPFDTQAVNDGVLSDEAFLAQVEAITDESERMLFHDLPRFKSGVLFSYFQGSDVVQHMFWRGIDPEHPLYSDPETQRHADAIPRFYARCDAILGRASAAMNNQGVVVVISDHGFAPFRRAVHLNAILRDLGWLTLKEGKQTSGELMADVDWSKTRAYAIGFNAVYLNLVGRESQGMVRKDDAIRAAKELTAALEAWVDPGSGTRPLRGMLMSVDKPTAPDMIIGYARGYRASWETALGAVPKSTVEPNLKKWSGDHCIDAVEVPGVYLSSDPALDSSSLAGVGAAIDRYLSDRVR
ncbi:MAG: alkaline phosphatase family protein [Planctomycetota bacterium]|nr:alkaline phosphatase family protein [Planctomycetota bacterium]